jgi:RNA polymerase sigma-70 factor (ECF subfamily)
MQDAVTLAKKPLLAVETHNHSEAHQSDEQLLARIAAGDRGALATLYVRHHVRLYRFLLRLVNNTATAEDLTSEVFLEVWKHAHRFEGRSQVSTWMLSIAHHRAMSALRRRADEPLDEAAAAEIADSADGPEAILLKQRQAAVLQQSLAQLSPAHREIIDLVYYHGKSVAEVAEIIGVPQSTVKTRMFYARKRLADVLSTHERAAA